MIYKTFQDHNLSALGLGCMRLPCGPGGDADIDEAAAAQMVDYAMAHGVNYFDTAWGYHMGNSETVVGRLLKKYPRDSFYLATKFPGYDLSSFGKGQEIFEKQLEKCQVDHFDFYLLHNVCEMNLDRYLEDTHGDVSYLLVQKQSGRIKHLGFSAHGSLEVMRRFLEVYGQHMEFCQIQLNWLDWTFQNAKAKVDLLNEYHIPVWVMEPLRGGALAKLEGKYAEKLAALRPDESVPGWAFRFLQTIPGVTVILSGMSNFEQLRDNVETFAEDKPLTSEEWDALLSIADAMLEKKTLSCTACRYCTGHCPQGLDIPWLIELYNEHAYSGGGFIAPMALSALEEEKKPSACIGCRSCEEVCPQQIKISEMMADFVTRLQ